jgi:hypothetical protein
MRIPLKTWLTLGAVVALASVGIAHAATSGGTIPPGPPGSDTTVRHISGFMFIGRTVTTPIISSSRGELGKLSISCNNDGSGNGVGNVTFTTDNTSSTLDGVTFTSTSPPTSTWQQVNGHATFSWAGSPPNDNDSFEMLLESQIGTSPGTALPTLTDIHGFIQHFSFGCNFYVHANTSEIASPMTIAS